MGSMDWWWWDFHCRQDFKHGIDNIRNSQLWRLWSTQSTFGNVFHYYQWGIGGTIYHGFHLSTTCQGVTMELVETLDKCIHSYLFLDIVKYLWKSKGTRTRTTSLPFSSLILRWDLTSFTHQTSAFKNPASEHTERLGGVEVENMVTSIGGKALCKHTNNNRESKHQPQDTTHDKSNLWECPCLTHMWWGTSPGGPNTVLLNCRVCPHVFRNDDTVTLWRDGPLLLR